MKKIVLIIAGFCFLFFTSFSQEIVWQNTIGGSDMDNINEVRQTADGGYILGGYSASDSSGDKTENSNGFYDFWIVKTDAQGNIQWEKTIGGSDHDGLLSLKQTTDGGYILGGYSESDISGDKTENCMGLSDYWIVKTDAAGIIQWQNTIGGNDQEGIFSLQQTTDGGYILGGYSDSDSSGDKTENNMDTSLHSTDYWLVKLDASGNIQWQNTIGGDYYDYLLSVQQTADGGYILGGHSESPISGDKTEEVGGRDYWVLKTDASGNIQWQNTIGANWREDFVYIQQTTDGGYIVGGDSYSDISGDKTENCWGHQDFWIVKLDINGTVQWENTIGGNNYDRFGSLHQTNDGGYIVGGMSNSNISGDKTENSAGGIGWGCSDYWVIKLDSSGVIQWQNSIGGTECDWLESLRQTADGGYILAGESRSNISWDKTENCIGSTDYWLLKLTSIYNSISGKLFIDANSNMIQDTGEPGVINKKITETTTGRFAFSQQNQPYMVSVLDSGNFTVSPGQIDYYTPNPATHSAYFSGTNQTDSLNDFAFQPAGTFNDLCVTITPMGNFRAGFNASYMINYENVGTTTLNGSVIFFPDNDITFVSSNPTATSITTDSIVWNPGTLTPFQSGNILVTVLVNAGTSIGTLINSTVRIEPVAGDANTGCNYSAYEVLVTGSFDPNEILVDRDTVFTTELSSPPYLNYTIYFQNTGNDTAFNASVLNNIPKRTDINSFEFVASSHPVNITYDAYVRLMTFTFNNILLPDSNVNEPASHGFIRYRIKPLDTLVAGNKIFNRASIYFDLNGGVNTNYAITEIVLPTGVSSQWSLGSGQLAVYPNPAQQSITIFSSLMTNDQCQMTIYDLFGRKVYQKQLETLNFKLETKINVSDFSQGIYFVELQSGEQVLRGKFLKQ